MATEKINALTFYMHDDVDEIFDEKGNMFLALRKIQWAKVGADPDPDKGKLELRKWNIKPDGSEIPGKGFSFLTENGPNELIDVLIEQGYGNTETILGKLKERDDFVEAVDRMYNGVDEDSDEYFDPREALLS